MTELAPTESTRAKPKKSPDDWLTRKESVVYLSSIGCPVTQRALEKRASNNNAGKGPAFTRIGWRTVRYKRSDLDAWAYRETTRCG
jgi:hypothetical protein